MEEVRVDTYVLVKHNDNVGIQQIRTFSTFEEAARYAARKNDIEYEAAVQILKRDGFIRGDSYTTHELYESDMWLSVHWDDESEE